MEILKCANALVAEYPDFFDLIGPLLTSVITLIGGWLIGQKISAQWNIHVKERESDIQAIANLREAYSEYLGVRRLWNIYQKNKIGPPKDEYGLRLLDRATHAEGVVESLLMKVTSERRIQQTDMDRLGLLRQGFQQLREAIAAGDRVIWGHSEHPHYIALKDGTVALSRIIDAPRRKLRSQSSTLMKRLFSSMLMPSSIEEPASQFKSVTNNKYEQMWESLNKNRGSISTISIQDN
jgi:hypothetical protein